MDADDDAKRTMIDVVLDVDTGVDDALALLLACRHPLVALKAVTCVAGNAAIDQVVANTRAVLATAGRLEIPLGRGAAGPLIGNHRNASHFHGSDGLGDLGLSVASAADATAPAVELLRRTILMAERPLSLVCLGPMTNLALLVRQHPDIAARCERIICMAGSLGRGMATPVAEFNVWHDPEAAAICLSAGLPITMYGLEVFMEVTVTSETVADLLEDPSPSAVLAGRLLGYLADASHRLGDMASGDDICIGDAGALCALIEPAGLTTGRYPVEVELAGTWTRGQTVVDRRRRIGEGELHGGAPRHRNLVDVAVAVDAKRYSALFLDALRSTN
ncbi:MAG TPA: nucleoside hydrolase [Acidimicrobiales bacterium]|nr:nucleoside hydrolase [Acidimicrobiales bacterium]